MFYQLKQEGSREQFINRIQNCLHDVCCWILNNLPNLNEEKTELIMLGRQQRLPQIDYIKITIGAIVIWFSALVRKFGVHLDQHLKNTVFIQIEKKFKPYCKKETKVKLEVFVMSTLPRL